MTKQRDELDALLVRRAIEGLGAEDARRLDELLEQHPDVDAGWADRVVGELDAESLAGREEALGPHLRDVLLDRGGAVVGGAPPAAESQDSGPSRPSGRSADPVKVGPSGADARAAAGRTAAAGGPGLPPGSPDPGSSDVSGDRGGPRRWGGWVGWALAAVLAGLLLVPSGPAGDEGAAGGLEPVRGLPAGRQPPSFRQVARARDAVVAAWSPGGDPAGAEVSGEMAWSGAAQVGVMRLSGLEPNAVGLQYQLWIFDGTRDERYPVDGGVFDVPPGAEEVEVPVRPAVPVRSPVLFAVTVERAGGVVVSDRERIATLAEVEE
jgi:hypothetical protein